MSIIKDPKTGFIWSTKLIKLSWKEAMNYCYDLDYAGYKDWRLPTKKELITLCKNNIFKDIGWFWTCEKYMPGATGALVVGFSSGVVDGGGKTGAYSVRPVRGGP